LPAAGLHKLGPNQVPFDLPGSRPNQPDTIVAAGQQIKLPAHAGGNTLYLLAACINGGEWTDIGFQLGAGRTEFRAFDLNDWVVSAYPDNEVGLSCPYRSTAASHDTFPCKMWIVHVPLPKGATGLILPKDSKVRLFAATIADRPEESALYGLSVLNNCKYGFDVSSNVFRLTALRSSSNPDPHPDQGKQKFTYSLYPHAGSWQAAHTDEQALALNIPLLAKVTTPHPATGRIPTCSVVNVGGKGDLIVSALKHSEDGKGYILRFYEADGQDTRARVDFDQPMRVEETDILERPLVKQRLMVQDNSVTLPVGHNKIISLHFWAGSRKEISLNP
jgi:Glycosyl hydrolases family 38 C-terminal beta sandwich domain/Glycosyl hydrolases family 38 C-terminal domain